MTLYYSNGVAWVTYPATNAMVFQPGGTAASNVYITEASLAAAAQALNGAPYTIFFDLSHVSGSYTFTTGDLNLGPHGTWTDLGNGYTLNLDQTLAYAPSFGDDSSLTVNVTGRRRDLLQ